MMNTPIIFNPEIRLTEHFKLGEFTKSITAERLGISNEPGYWEVYGRRLRERYILKKVDRGDPMIRF